jgi:hypothetical protein
MKMDNLTKQLLFVLSVAGTLLVVATGVVPWLVTGYVTYLLIALGAVGTAGAIVGLIGGIFWIAGKIFPDS